MFKCQKCSDIIRRGEKENHIVIEKRQKFYHYYVVEIRKSYGKNRKIITEDATIARDKDNKKIKEYSAKGWEIAKELIVCNKCFKEGQNGR